ncbi:MAG: ATPase, T2SS/T4P/T4SS family [Alphaproteobacteria bacterium]|nr:ATPase, T2SS/T4P/T4SS family [Alphaproteobacteria bacterium]
MVGPVVLSAAERRLCAVTGDGVLLYDSAKKGDIAIFEVRRRLEAALGRTAETRPVAIIDIDRINATGAPVRVPSVRARSDIEELSRRILENAALLEASDIHLSVDNRSGLGKVTLRVRGKLTHPVHELRSDECSRLLNLIFARLDEGPQTLRENRNQSGAILQQDKLPPGVGGARIQTVWPGNGFHLNIRLRYSQSTLGLDSLDDLGLPDAVVTDLRYMATASRGLVLVSGPTESGKSTILATLTREIFHAAGGLLTIASAEDPVEEWHDHLLQIPVNTDELGDDAWIEAQKLFTRIAPDIGQVGEIRTGEAAERAYSFADTGKLTLATIHVSSALDIPFRLMSGLGISPARALDPGQNPAWTSQRLVPLLCPSCRIPETGAEAPVHPSRKAVRQRFLDHGFDLSGACRRGPGCPDCDPRARTGLSRGGTPGLAGRQLVLEVVLPDSDLARLLDAGDRAGARRHWISSGGQPLSIQTWNLVQEGLVDLGDYRHHIGGPDALLRDVHDHERTHDQAPGIRVTGLEPLVFFPPGPGSAPGELAPPGPRRSRSGATGRDTRPAPSPRTGAGSARGGDPRQAEPVGPTAGPGSDPASDPATGKTVVVDPAAATAGSGASGPGDPGGGTPGHGARYPAAGDTGVSGRAATDPGSPRSGTPPSAAPDPRTAASGVSHPPAPGPRTTGSATPRHGEPVGAETATAPAAGAKPATAKPRATASGTRGSRKPVAFGTTAPATPGSRKTTSARGSSRKTASTKGSSGKTAAGKTPSPTPGRGQDAGGKRGARTPAPSSPLEPAPNTRSPGTDTAPSQPGGNGRRASGDREVGTSDTGSLGGVGAAPGAGVTQGPTTASGGSRRSAKAPTDTTVSGHAVPAQRAAAKEPPAGTPRTQAASSQARASRRSGTTGSCAPATADHDHPDRPRGSQAAGAATLPSAPPTGAGRDEAQQTGTGGRVGQGSGPSARRAVRTVLTLGASLAGRARTTPAGKSGT